jgi:hypothetical protein
MIASDELDAATSVLVPIEVANAMRKYGMAAEVAAEIRAIFSSRIDVYSVDGQTLKRRQRFSAKRG